jgi:hypothetical protein
VGVLGVQSLLGKFIKAKISKGKIRRSLSPPLPLEKNCREKSGRAQSKIFDSFELTPPDVR